MADRDKLKKIIKALKKEKPSGIIESFLRIPKKELFDGNEIFDNIKNNNNNKIKKDF